MGKKYEKSTAKARFTDHSQRIEPFGWDAEDRTYYMLDDNRLYRETEPLIETPPPKAKKSKARPKARGSRSSKRRRVVPDTSPEEEDHDEQESGLANGVSDEPRPEDIDTCGGRKWELVAITLDEFNAFVAGIKKTRDHNEKVMYKRMIESVLPFLLEREEERRKKAERKQREVETMQKLAFAKRSSRLANKREVQRAQAEAEEAEKKRREEDEMVRKQEAKKRKLEEVSIIISVSRLDADHILGS